MLYYLHIDTPSRKAWGVLRNMEDHINIKGAKTHNLKNISPAKELIKTEALNQFNLLIKPISPYLPYIFPLIVFFSVLQILIIIRPLFYPLTWLFFQFILVLKIAHLTIQEEPVEVLEV